MLKSDNEAEKIYYAIFKKNIPLSTKNHFDKISEKIDARYPLNEITKYHHLLAKAVDLEAIEVAARYLRTCPILNDKFKLMIFLAETLPENYGVFINEQSRHLSAYLSLAFSVFRTVYKLSKGAFYLALNRI